MGHTREKSEVGSRVLSAHRERPCAAPDSNGQDRGLFGPQGAVPDKPLQKRNITYISIPSPGQNRCSYRTIEFSPKKKVGGGRRTRDFGRPGLAAYPPAPLASLGRRGGPRLADPPGAAHPAESRPGRGGTVPPLPEIVPAKGKSRTAE